MVDVIPVLLFVYGCISISKPEWAMKVHRWQKAAGTKNRPADIEPSDVAYAVNYVAGAFFLLFGLVFTLQSL